MVDTWNPAKLNEKISGCDSWNPAILNEAVTDRDSWNPAILNKNLESTTPVVFEATITASFPEGATCTATDGTTTLTADDNPMAFSIPNEGTWAVACVANGVTFSENVVITTNGQTETVDLTPVGDTYATTDSVPVLIACAGIGDSEITTIAGALEDVETLTAILESENAVDYLVRSTSFASGITGNSNAMTYIGANNYAADTLLSDVTWLNAICNSTYFESVLNVKVPIMTSDTTPSGEAFASSVYSASYKAYLAFDGNDAGTPWAPSLANTIDSYLGYDFGSSIKIAKVVIKDNGKAVNRPTAITLQGFNGVDWDDIGSFTRNAQTTSDNIYSSTGYTKIRIKVTAIGGVIGTNTIYVYATQFYGRADV